MTVFISYQQRDVVIAEQLDEALRNEGIETVFAPESLRGGENFLQWIEDEIDRSSHVVALYSENARGSEYMLMEASLARRKLIPTFLDSVTSVPVIVGPRNALDLVGYPEVTTGFRRLLGQLATKPPKRDNHSFGPMVVPDAVLLSSCDRNTADEDDAEGIFFEFSPGISAERAIPADLTSLTAARLPSLKAIAKARKSMFLDQPVVDVVGASFERPVIDGRGRRRVHTLDVGNAWYFPFATLSNMLDEPIDGNAGDTVDRRLGHPRPTLPEEMAELGVPIRVGVVVPTITKDRQVVLHQRSKGKNFEAANGAHFVGEGALPKDIDPVTGAFSPLLTAMRGLREELGLRPAEVRLSRTGVFIDQSRLQLVFLYVAETDLTFAQISVLQHTRAPDKWESAYLASTPWTIENPEIVRLLMQPVGATSTNRVQQSDGIPSCLASNHAQMALLQSMIFAHGPLHLLDHLGWPLGYVADRN